MKSFLDRLQDRPYVVKGSQIKHTLEAKTLLGLEVVRQHEGYNSEDIITTPFYRSVEYLLRARGGVNILHYHKSYFQGRFLPAGIPKTQNRSFIYTVEHESYFELMHDTLNFTATQSIDFAFDFYLQSFVDTFNKRKDTNYDNGPIVLPFQEEKEVQKHAMKTNNQFILKFRENPSMLAGFASDGPVRKNKEDINKLISYFK